MPEPCVCQTTPMRRSPGEPPRILPDSVGALLLGEHPRFGPQLDGAQRFGDGELHRVELVIAGHLLDQRAAAVVLEHDEVPDELQEPLRQADALQQHLQLRHAQVRQRLAS